MATRRTPSQIVRSGVRAYTTSKEARGVTQNLKAGGTTRKRQLRRLKGQVWGELKPRRAKKVMRAARKVKR